MSEIIYLSVAGIGVFLLLLSFFFDLDFFEMEGFSFSFASLSAGVTSFGVFGYLATLVDGPALIVAVLSGLGSLVLGGFLLALVKKKTATKEVRNYRGAFATVTSVIKKGNPGTVKISSVNELGDRMAYTNDEQDLPAGTPVVIVADSGSTVTVTRAL